MFEWFGNVGLDEIGVVIMFVVVIDCNIITSLLFAILLDFERIWWRSLYFRSLLVLGILFFLSMMRILVLDSIWMSE